MLIRSQSRDIVRNIEFKHTWPHDPYQRGCDSPSYRIISQLSLCSYAKWFLNMTICCSLQTSAPCRTGEACLHTGSYPHAVTPRELSCEVGWQLEFENKVRIKLTCWFVLVWTITIVEERVHCVVIHHSITIVAMFNFVHYVVSFKSLGSVRSLCIKLINNL